MIKKGRLIVIEGTDGSGKATQVKALVSKVESEKIPISSISFPRYETKEGRRITEYLRGKYGDPTKVSPKLAARLYAVDRRAAKHDISLLLIRGTNVICDRYVGSNLAHQGAKLPEEQREGFVKWVEELEYRIFEIPKPDLTVCLNLHPEQAGKAINLRNRERDGHETNAEYQKKVVETYLWLAKTKHDWRLIECMEGDRRKSIGEIAENIWKIIEPVLVR